jgi:hypothetical protein
MSNDRYKPRQLDDETLSLINEPIGALVDDVTVLPCVRREPPLRAIMLDILGRTQTLLGCLEHGVPASTDRQRAAVRSLYERSREQLQALAACLDLLAGDR